MKRILGTVLALVLLTGSCAFADSAVDVILNTGTTQAFTDQAVPAADLETILKEGRVFSDDVAERREP